MVITMILPTHVYAQTTEDDGYTDEYDNGKRSQEEQDEQAEQDWKDAGKPGEG